jgi:hypothetical protein
MNKPDSRLFPTAMTRRDILIGAASASALVLTAEAAAAAP